MSLIAHYLLNETSGTSIADASGNGRTGTAARDMSLTTAAGKINTAYSTNGSSDVIRVADHALLNFGSALTAMAWILVPTAADANRTIMGQYDTGANKRAWMLRVSATGTAPAGPGEFLAYFTSGGTSGTIRSGLVDGLRLDDNAWHHVAMTFNAGTIVMVVDGANKTVTIIDSATVTSIYNADVNITIGARLNNNVATEFLPGRIDDVRIYNTVLSLAEIQAVYNGGAGHEHNGPIIPKLVAA